MKKRKTTTETETNINIRIYVCMYGWMDGWMYACTYSVYRVHCAMVIFISCVLFIVRADVSPNKWRMKELVLMIIYEIENVFSSVLPSLGWAWACALCSVYSALSLVKTCGYCYGTYSFIYLFIHMSWCHCESPKHNTISSALIRSMEMSNITNKWRKQ